MNYNRTPESVLVSNSTRLNTLDEYVHENMVNRPYHNYAHAKDAAHVFGELAANEGVCTRDAFSGISAMIMHDLITVPFARDNEERTIDEARRLLPLFGYNADEIEQISKIIYATKVGVEPTSLLEMIAKDADTQNLGRNDFFEKNAALRNEFSLADNVKWYEGTLKFMQAHKFYTESAKMLCDAKKSENMQKVSDLINAALDIAPSKTCELLEEK